MNYNVIATRPFERKLKRLLKKHKSLKEDLRRVIQVLIQNPTAGDAVGKDCYKVRVAIRSKGKGKSSGARLITYVKIQNETVYLLDIYDKSEHSSISDKDLKLLIALLE